MAFAIKTRAPLRFGFAGGGTDVEPFASEYGGAVVNATIDLYAHASLRPRDDGKILLHAIDRNEFFESEAVDKLPIDTHLPLVKGIYNRVVKDFAKKPLSFEISTHVDAPAGSGLGTSSTFVVTVLQAFLDWLDIDMPPHEVAALAYSIEREDLGFEGGKQDQYSASHGGFNFFEFQDGGANRTVIPVEEEVIHRLGYNIVLYYTETSRVSADIIRGQMKNIAKKKEKSVAAMHKLKEQAHDMKDTLLLGDFDTFGILLDEAWHHKKQTADGISAAWIDEIYDAAKKAGALGGKVSGAGGGGCMIFYCPEGTRCDVVRALSQFGGQVRRYDFTNQGVQSWKI